MGKYIDSLQLARAKEDPKITDKVGRYIFTVALEAANNDDAVYEFEWCNAKRLGDTASQHKAAYIYFALAFGILKSRFAVLQGGKEISAGRMFHFAGHAFREIGQLNRAADAYWRAGVIEEKNAELSIRSLARAKSAYSEIGQTDKSDEMHRLEWDARRAKSKGPKWLLLSAWKLTSAFGTRAGPWFISVGLFLLVFTAAYQILYRFGHIAFTQGTATWTPWLTAGYMAVVTTGTVGYGDFVPSGPLAQIVVVLNITLAYALLAIGSTILGRKVLAR